MNFRDIENIENLASSSGNTMSDFHQEIIADYLEKEKRKSGAKENPFIYFYEDVIANVLAYDFQSVLGKPYYKNASDDALSCLNICDNFYRLSSWCVNGWLQNALKFTDHLVLHYIQDICNNIPKKFPNTGIEKSRYKQLGESNDDEIRRVGIFLENLYDLRNDLEHRTIIHEDGRQEIIKPKLAYVRKNVIKLYPNVLDKILKTYKDIHI
jgi:hypothetical protein